MRLLAYRCSQVTVVLLLVGWALSVLAAILFPGGHPGLFIIFVPWMVWATWIMAPLGLLCGAAATVGSERRAWAVLLMVTHAMLLLIAFAIAEWLRKWIVF